MATQDVVDFHLLGGCDQAVVVNQLEGLGIFSKAGAKCTAQMTARSRWRARSNSVCAFMDAIVSAYALPCPQAPLGEVACHNVFRVKSPMTSTSVLSIRIEDKT